MSALRASFRSWKWKAFDHWENQISTECAKLFSLCRTYGIKGELIKKKKKQEYSPSLSNTNRIDRSHPPITENTIKIFCSALSAPPLVFHSCPSLSSRLQRCHHMYKVSAVSANHSYRQKKKKNGTIIVIHYFLFNVFSEVATLQNGGIKTKTNGKLPQLCLSFIFFFPFFFFSSFDLTGC